MMRWLLALNIESEVVSVEDPAGKPFAVTVDHLVLCGGLLVSRFLCFCEFFERRI